VVLALPSQLDDRDQFSCSSFFARKHQQIRDCPDSASGVQPADAAIALDLARAARYSLVEKGSGATVWRFPPDAQEGIRLVDFRNLDKLDGYHAVLCDLFSTLPDQTTRSFFSLRDRSGLFDVLFELFE
jgi:hypothetical protein